MLWPYRYFDDALIRYGIAMFSCRVSDRHELRLLQMSDADDLFALTDANRAHLRKWLPWLDARYGLTNTQDFIRYTLQQLADNLGVFACLYYDRSMVGTISLNRIDWQNRSGYIGYWLAESHQGRGIMTESCKTVIHHAFTVLKLNRLVIYCASENQRSRAIPERLGFVHEGVAREAEWLYDHFVDLEIYSLLHREWVSQH
jgi:ribosomal-protein-serine acetyltransferase